MGSNETLREFLVPPTKTPSVTYGAALTGRIYSAGPLIRPPTHTTNPVIRPPFCLHPFLARTAPVQTFMPLNVPTVGLF
ncbi:Uncharacterized protein APZ42_001101 [Daphnia magna]|uniref:Uncharacterized protein n=1 Tax=Daphnia magna TaxID=35525 RepID=A0A164J676_9CRUS|nr:Uncharacterized protein APZ42_001101 [Daphnia magna]